MCASGACIVVSSDFFTCPLTLKVSGVSFVSCNVVIGHVVTVYGRTPVMPVCPDGVLLVYGRGGGCSVIINGCRSRVSQRLLVGVSTAIYGICTLAIHSSSMSFNARCGERSRIIYGVNRPESTCYIFEAGAAKLYGLAAVVMPLICLIYFFPPVIRFCLRRSGCFRS